MTLSYIYLVSFPMDPIILYTRTDFLACAKISIRIVFNAFLYLEHNKSITAFISVIHGVKQNDKLQEEVRDIDNLLSA